MELNLDAIIFIIFISATLIIGLRTSRGANTIEQYAIGDRDFNTATLVATIVATWISGEFFYSSVSEAYKNGLYSIWIALGDPIYLLIVGLFFAPRMGEFLGNLSIAEAMGNLYGPNIRYITAFSSFVASAGIIALQIKLAGFLFKYILGISEFYGVILTTFIVTLYSALGGIRSVTFTDVIQFGTFSVAIPMIAYNVLSKADGFGNVINVISSHELFDYKQVFDFSNSFSFKQLSLFLLFIIPGIGPEIFQRIAIAKDTKQVGDSFLIAAFTCLCFAAILNWLAVLLFASNPNIEVSDVIQILLFDNLNIGMKGLLIAGIMAMIMSTVDSFINSTSVIIVHDLLSPLKIINQKHQLRYARISAVIIGFTSMILSLREGSLLELLVITESFYLPIISPSFCLAIFGFRSSSKAIIVGMLTGLGFIIVNDYIIAEEEANSVFIAFMANTLAIFLFHYLFSQSGGWVGIKDTKPLEDLRAKRLENRAKMINNIKNFDLAKVLNKNSPEGDGLIAILGLFLMLSAFAGAHNLPKEYLDSSFILMDLIYPFLLVSSSLLMSYPLWLPAWKKTIMLPLIWNVVMFVGLIFFNFSMVLISGFAEMTMMIFLTNLFIISTFVSWRWALGSIIIGMILSYSYCDNFMPPSINEFSTSLQFRLIYILVTITTLLIIFLKPKQEYIDVMIDKSSRLSNENDNLSKLNSSLSQDNKKLTHKVEDYDNKLQLHEKEIERLSQTAQRILNNVNHELRLPVGNVMNFAEIMREGLGKFSEKDLQKVSEEVLKNSTRLSSMILNMLDLAMLEAKKITLNKHTVNLSEMISARAKRCYDLYREGKEVSLKLDLEPEVLVKVDPNYIRQVIDNLLINAIKYSDEAGEIKVTLRSNSNIAQIEVTDKGLGIGKKDLVTIFEPFMVGSNNFSKAEGRGIGLTLCKRAIEAHGGDIIAESNGKKGACFTVQIPKDR